MKLVRCFSAFLLCLCLAVCFTACGGDEKNKSEPRPASSVTETDGETTTEPEAETKESDSTTESDAPDTGNTETDKPTDQNTNKRNDETKAADTQKANAGADVVITAPSDSETTGGKKNGSDKGQSKTSAETSGGSEPSGEQKTPDTEQKTPDTSEEPASGIVLPNIDI